MLVKKYKSEVVSISNPLDGLYTLQLAPQKGKFKYSPGQFLHLAIDGSYDGVGQWPDSRCFSMQSNPDEFNIRVTYTVKGRFTSQMEKLLNVGSKVWLKMPYGDLFTREHSKVNTVFIAGGTGVTPFLSLFSHDSFTEYTKPKIYFGFRTKKHNIYLNELDRTQSSTANIHSFYEDVDGSIDIESIFDENGIDRSYFISGPPEMIKHFKHYLLKMGLCDKDILTDDWM